jgi:hypothetical protein
MKYVTLFTFMCLLLSFEFLPAQAPDTLWTRTYGGSGGDIGYSVQQTSDGGYIISGVCTMDQDIWLLKTDASGDSLWSKTYGDWSYEVGHSVQQTTDGGYVVIGHTYRANRDYDVWLLKTDALGDTLWTKTFGGDGVDNGHSVRQTIDGGYIITGVTYPGSEDGDVYLVKTNALGDTIWTTTFGGNEGDWGNSVQQTADGGYIIAGVKNGSGIGIGEGYLIKTNTFGDTLWTRTFHGYGNCRAASVQQTSDGGYIITGGTNASGGIFGAIWDIWLLKTDTSGDSLWSKTYGGNETDYGNSVQQTTDGGYIITGHTYPSGSNVDVYLIKTNASGDTLWTRTIGGSYTDVGMSVQQTADGGYIITGYTDPFGTGDYDLRLIKTKPEPMNLRRIEAILVSDYNLSQNYPNPFNPTTTIEFDLPKTSDVILKIYNILGEEVTTLVSDRLTAGSYTYDWNASNMASGVYLYRLEAGGFVETRKMVLMR